jgi:hypothetical protein
LAPYFKAFSSKSQNIALIILRLDKLNFARTKLVDIHSVFEQVLDLSLLDTVFFTARDDDKSCLASNLWACACVCQCFLATS